MDRRTLMRSAAAAAVAAALSPVARAGNRPLADVPRSDFGPDTTCDDVVAGRDLAGLSVLVTGCNSGLGYESMRCLAGAGAHVIGAARTRAKAEEACASVAGRATPVVCELTEMDSVVACAEAVAALDEPLDVAMFNAGIMALPELRQIEIGDATLEQQFVVNHLGHYLLMRRLLPVLESAEQPRAVWVSSSGYRLAPPEGIDFANLSGEQGYKPFRAYGRSKLANILTSNELSRRYADAPLTSNAIHPGIVRTNLGRYILDEPTDPDEPMRPGMKRPPEGAATQVYVAIEPRLVGFSGFYFGDCNPEEFEGPHARDAELAARLWEESEALVSDWL